MFKALFNRVHIRCIMTPVSGFLVKSSDFMAPHQADSGAIRTTQADGSKTVFIPGSSIKGVVRSAGERILRSLSYEHAQWLAARSLHAWFGVRCCNYGISGGLLAITETVTIV